MSDPREATLRALMAADAREFARRELGRAGLIETDAADPLVHSKKVSEIKRLLRVRQERIAAGLIVRKSKWPTGTMAAGERGDHFRATDGVCVVCGKAHERIRSRTCSPACGRAARAAKKAVNHTREARSGGP